MEEVPTLSFQVGVAFGHDPALFLPIRRPVLFPREVTLCAFQPLAFVGQVERFNGGSVRVVGVLENPNVDPDTLLGMLGLRRCVVLGFESEHGELLPSGFLLDGDLLDGCVVRDLAVVDHRNFADLGKREYRPTARGVRRSV